MQVNQYFTSGYLKIGLLALLLMYLQVQIWVVSLPQLWKVQRQIAAQTEANQVAQERNRVLEAEVMDLKVGLVTVEAIARSELGMVREGEQFIQIVEE